MKVRDEDLIDSVLILKLSLSISPTHSYVSSLPSPIQYGKCMRDIFWPLATCYDALSEEKQRGAQAFLATLGALQSTPVTALDGRWVGRVLKLGVRIFLLL